MIRYITESEARAHLSIEDTVASMESLFREDIATLPAIPRQVVDVPEAQGITLFMPARHPGRGLMGIKVSSIRPLNRDLPVVNGAYLLLDHGTGVALALIESNVITRLRTAAVSAMVTRSVLGETGRHALGILGGGAQAMAHAEALCSVLHIESLSIHSRSPQRAAACVEAIRAQPWAPATVRLAVELAGALEDISILCTCTSTDSTRPLIGASDLPASLVHINAIGGRTIHALELDPEIYRHAVPIVETLEDARADCGEIREGLARGLLQPEQIVTVSALVRRPGPYTPPCRLSIYRSVGHALEDLALADLIWRRVTRDA
jgi:alanine dehydrogenase